MKFELKMVYFAVAGVVLLIIVGLVGYFAFQRSQNTQVEGDTKKLIEEVGKLIELPQGEDPTVATVTDVEKLRDQVFFQRAQNGDKVLIYQNAKKAILYSPTLKKVIDVAPINLGSPSAQVSESPSPSPTASPKVSPTPED